MPISLSPHPLPPSWDRESAAVVALAALAGRWALPFVRSVRSGSVDVAVASVPRLMWRMLGAMSKRGWWPKTYRVLATDWAHEAARRATWGMREPSPVRMVAVPRNRDPAHREVVESDAAGILEWSIATL